MALPSLAFVAVIVANSPHLLVQTAYERRKANEDANWRARMSSDRAEVLRLAPADDSVHKRQCAERKCAHQALVNESCRHHSAMCQSGSSSAMPRLQASS